ncbi:unnamed protein product [Dracunculus medinensis]|uniref:AraC family transcriptional regulator n=1 Tax=Dracunculus medinensis TaxID=318479 RepID=A0A0N4UBH4_DRAME|nr:unnamed protein product [Dracunculus medinensis]
MNFADDLRQDARIQRRSIGQFSGNFDRRSFDELDFQNCFLSPVQCMLPRMNRRR